MATNNVVVSLDLLGVLVSMATAHAEDIEEGLNDGTYDASENEDFPSKKLAIAQAQALIDDPAHADSNEARAILFMKELQESVETLSGIAEEHGIRTLSDLMYLQDAILTGGFIDALHAESAVYELVAALPSGAVWTNFIRRDVLDSLVAVPNKHLPTNFKAAVAMLMRPYHVISKYEYEQVCDLAEDANTDILLLKGTQVTFGHADGGYALMPLSTPI